MPTIIYFPLTPSDGAEATMKTQHAERHTISVCICVHLLTVNLW